MINFTKAFSSSLLLLQLLISLLLLFPYFVCGGESAIICFGYFPYTIHCKKSKFCVNISKANITDVESVSDPLVCKKFTYTLDDGYSTCKCSTCKYEPGFFHETHLLHGARDVVWGLMKFTGWICVQFVNKSPFSRLASFVVLR